MSTSPPGRSGTKAEPVPGGENVGPRLAYMPALDGVRAVAVLGVMAYHGGVTGLGGGYLGVDTFFVLSGFLITSLLVTEWDRLGTVRLGAFWARRARRLLPALLAMLIFVACYGAFAVPRGTYPDLRLDALSTLFYVANWHSIVAGASYFARTALPSPLTPTWSLAIEEQFYLCWPLLVLGVLTLTRRLGPLLAVCVAGAAASAAEMALLYRSGTDATRLYYGTDTHAQSLLVGAALAVALALRAPSSAARPTRATRTGVARTPHRPAGGDATGRVVALLGAGLLGVAVSGYLWSHLLGGSGPAFEGGFLLADLATAMVLLSVVRAPATPLAAALSWAPVRYLGRISYGMYLWHYPLFLWLDGARTGITGPALFLARTAATVAVAAGSFHLLERPVRQRALFRRPRAWLPAAPALAGTVVVVLALTTVPAAPAVPAAGAAPSGRGQATPLAPGRPVKVLVIGDSTALTLGTALVSDAARYHVAESDKAIVGCGVVDGREVRTRGTVERVMNACDDGPLPAGAPQVASEVTPFGAARFPDAERWTAWYRHWVDTLDPNVVVLLAGRWEVMTRTYRGRWTNILHPAFADHVERQLVATIRLAASRGARVALLTAPCYDPGEQPDGEPWPTASPARVTAFNRLVRRAAAAVAAASVLTLRSLVCPGGTYRQVVDGTTVRQSDGVHFALGAGTYLGPRLWPSIVRIGREQMAARPGA